MTKKELHKGNGLITKFMGWELIQTKDELKVWVFKNKNTGRVLLLDDTDPYNKKFWNKDSVINFIESWDILMPVLNKAYGIIDDFYENDRRNEERKYYTIRTTLFNVLNTFQCDNYDKKGKKEEKYNIERVWKHLVDFIECYDRYNYEQELLKRARSKK